MLDGTRELQLATAKLILDLVPSDAIPALAMRAIEATLESPSLLALALSEDVRREEVLALLEPAFGELGLRWPSVHEAVETLARDTAAQLWTIGLGRTRGRGISAISL